MVARRRAFALSTLVVAAVVSASPVALGFCRATTCVMTKTETCPTDEHNCQLDGAPLLWPNGETGLDLDSAGSELRSISADDFHGAVTGALEAWISAKCPGGGHPSLRITIPKLVDGAVAEYVGGGPNENVVVFYDKGWPQEPTALGKTAMRFDLGGGTILDADIELNSEDYAFSTDGSGTGIDLEAVLTHEVGHLLGLDHSDAPGATMQPETTRGFGELELRTLSQDDVEGICAIYPPGAPVIEAPQASAVGAYTGGSSGSCSLSRAGLRAHARRSDWAMLVATLVLGAALGRRARRRVVGVLHR